MIQHNNTVEVPLVVTHALQILNVYKTSFFVLVLFLFVRVFIKRLELIRLGFTWKVQVALLDFCPFCNSVEGLGPIGLVIHRLRYLLALALFIVLAFTKRRSDMLVSHGVWNLRVPLYLLIFHLVERARGLNVGTLVSSISEHRVSVVYVF